MIMEGEGPTRPMGPEAVLLLSTHEKSCGADILYILCSNYGKAIGSIEIILGGPDASYSVTPHSMGFFSEILFFQSNF